MGAKIVPLTTYPNEMEARMAAQILEENDIPAVVKPMGGGYGVLGVTSFIHHRVYVPEDNLKQAEELLASYQEYEVTEDSQGTSVS
jgi:hypothetical protein